MTDLYALNSKSFADQLHTGFTVPTGNGVAITLALVEVKESATAPGIECFSLLFRGPVAPRLEQRIHRFEHQKLGSLDMFLTVIGADQAGTSYEVIFHRVRPKQP